jgi:hypothetical protein
VAHILEAVLVAVRYRLAVTLVEGNQMFQLEMDILVQDMFLTLVRQVGVVAEAQIQPTQEQEMQGDVHFKVAQVVVLAD